MVATRIEISALRKAYYDAPCNDPKEAQAMAAEVVSRSRTCLSHSQGVSETFPSLDPKLKRPARTASAPPAPVAKEDPANVAPTPGEAQAMVPTREDTFQPPSGIRPMPPGHLPTLLSLYLPSMSRRARPTPTWQPLKSCRIISARWSSVETVSRLPTRRNTSWNSLSILTPSNRSGNSRWWKTPKRRTKREAQGEVARRRTQVARAKSAIPSRSGYAPYVVKCAAGRHDPLGNGTARAGEEEATARLIASGKSAKPAAAEAPEDAGPF